MYFFDTDHMTFIDKRGVEYQRIQARLRNVPPDDVATTIISYEQQTRGWLARIAQMRTPENQVPVYSELKRQLNNYCKVAVIEFDARAVSPAGVYWFCVTFGDARPLLRLAQRVMGKELALL